MIVGSFTDNDTVIVNGYSLFPKKMSMAAYDLLLLYPQRIINSYQVTIFVTIVGTMISLLVTTATGYALSRPDFRIRNKIAFFFYFPSLFSGGLIPWYIMMTQVLSLNNSLWALIVPSIFSAFNAFLVRNFIKTSVPPEIFDSAKIDGAGDFRIFGQIVLSLIQPVVATIGLFISLGYWNEWYLAMLFISSPEKYPLQYYLYNLLISSRVLSELAAQGYTVSETLLKVPQETSKLAMAVVATGPIIMVYPFVQRYFIKGIVIGAVKG